MISRKVYVIGLPIGMLLCGVVCIALAWFSPASTRLQIDGSDLFEWKPCLVGASERYAKKLGSDSAIGAHAAAFYCEAENAADLDRRFASERGPIHDMLAHGAAILMAQQQRK
jgi:hypothetical protein